MDKRKQTSTLEITVISFRIIIPFFGERTQKQESYLKVIYKLIYKETKKIATVRHYTCGL